MDRSGELTRSAPTPYRRQMLLPLSFVAPCLPTKAPHPPTGTIWVHEIKHDGFRIIARKDGNRVRLYSRAGNDLTDRFPLIVAALGGLRSRSVILDGEAVACDEDGISNFDRLRHRHHDGSVFLYAFDLIELNGDDLRREPLEVRKGHVDLSPSQGPPWYPGQRAYRGRRTDRVRPRLQDGVGRHRVETQRFDLPIRPVARLAQKQEPGLCGSESGG